MEEKKMIVWLIDDNEIDNFINRKTLLKNKAVATVKDFTSATTAQSYIDQLLLDSSKANEIPDYIFLDLNMPVFSGMDFLDKCEDRLMELNPKIKIAILTSSINPNDEFTTSLYSTFKAYINKPLNISSVEALFA